MTDTSFVELPFANPLVRGLQEIEVDSAVPEGVRLSLLALSKMYPEDTPLSSLEFNEEERWANRVSWEFPWTLVAIRGGRGEKPPLLPDGWFVPSAAECAIALLLKYKREGRWSVPEGFLIHTSTVVGRGLYAMRICLKVEQNQLMICQSPAKWYMHPTEGIQRMEGWAVGRDDTEELEDWGL